VWIRNPYPVNDDSYREQWLPSKFCARPVWVPAEVTAFSSAGPELAVATLLQPRMAVRVAAEHVLPMNSITSLDNVVDFVYLHEAAVLYNVARRALEGSPVTRAGPAVLLSVNPCRTPMDADGISTYDVAHMAQYRGRLPLRAAEAAVPAPARPALALPPHVWDAAEAVLEGVRAEGQPQALLFMGDAGSGKSEALKAVLQYLVCAGPLGRAGVIPGSVTPAALMAALDSWSAKDLTEGSASLTPSALAFAACRANPSLPPLLCLSDADLAYARADAGRRRGPLGSARNPWVTHPPALAALQSSSAGSAGSAVTLRPPAVRSTDFYSDEAGPLPGEGRGEGRRAGSASAAAAAVAGAGGAGAPAPFRALAQSIPQLGGVLLAAVTVLEAFGGAATPSNPNSSRFVRTIKLQYDKAGGLASARLEAALLDGRRVLGAAADPASYGLAGPGAGMPPPGRNFHVFYQLLAGAARKTHAALQLGGQGDYLALQTPRWAVGLGETVQVGVEAPAHPPVQHIHGTPLASRSGSSAAGGTVLSPFSTSLLDGEEFPVTCRALEALSIDPPTQSLLFCLLSAILIAGNVRFAEADEHDVAGGAAPSLGAALLSTPLEVALLADLLSVDRLALADALVKKGRGTSWSWRKGGEARTALDGILVGLYTRLFTWLVARANGALEGASEGASGRSAAPSPGYDPLTGSHMVAGADTEDGPDRSITLVDAPGLEGVLSPAIECALSATSAASLGRGDPLPPSSAPVRLDTERLTPVDALGPAYASELLSSAFTRSLFTDEEALYEGEGIEYVPLTHEGTGARAAALLADRRVGLAAVWDEMASNVRGSDTALAVKMGALHGASTSYVRPGEGGGGLQYVSSLAGAAAGSSAAIPAQSVGFDPATVFGVAHTGGLVLYSTTGATAGARASSGPDLGRGDGDLLRVLSSSGNSVLLEVLGLLPVGSTVGGVPELKRGSASGPSLSVPFPLHKGVGLGTPAPPTPGAKAVETVDAVLRPFVEAGGPTLMFLKCLRPNTALQPGFVDPSLLHAQLRASGALHAVAARIAGFPTRLSFADFYARYILVVHGLEDDAERGRRAAGVGASPASPRRLVFPPPPHADPRELCRDLLAIASRHPVFSHLRSDLRSMVQFGTTRVFLKAAVADTLEALRDVRLATMDRQASRIRAAWKGHVVRRAVRTILTGVRRLQAGWAAAQARASWLAVRRAAIRIQAVWRGFACAARYMAARVAVRRLQSWARSSERTSSWRRMRKGMRTLHALSRGFIIRCHVMRMLAAVVKLQGTARMFLTRCRVHRLRQAAAAALQAVWRGRRFRVYNEDVLVALATRREVRTRSAAAANLQALWRGCTARREYAANRAKVVALQAFYTTRLARQKFMKVKAAAVLVQAFIRGLLTRARAARAVTLRAVAEELWHVHGVRGAELGELSRAAVEDAILALPPALRAPVAASASTSVMYVSPPPAPGAVRELLPPRTITVAARTGAGASTGAGSSASCSTFTASCLLDVDALGDTLAVYPGSLTRALTAVERELRGIGAKTAGIALGSTHALVLTDGGHVYSWGFGDRGQTGHGRWAYEAAPRLLECLLTDKELAAAQERAAPLPSAGGSVRVTPTKAHSPSPSLLPAVFAPLRIKSVAAGDEHSLALTDSGRAFAWGNGRRGALGSSAFESSCVPVQVRLSLTPADTASLPANLAMMADGGEGRGAEDLMSIVEIGAGSNYSAALTSSGLVFTWGEGACLGVGMFSGTGDSAVPCLVRDLVRHRVRHLGTGPSYCAVVTAGGDVFTWGVGKEGQLGHGVDGGASSRFKPRYRPTLVEGFAAFDKHSRITAVSAGARHVLALSSTGRVYAWGSNSHGQLGLGVPGPLPEAALRKAGVPLSHTPPAQTVAAVDRLSRVPGAATGPDAPVLRPYCPVPAWVWPLDQHHVTSIAASSRSSAVLTDRKEALAWGATHAPSALVDADALLLRAYSVMRGVPLGAAKKRAASVSSAASDVGSDDGGEALPPLAVLESGRGPLELNIVPYPSAVPLHAVPGRTPRRLLPAFSSSASLLGLVYTQAAVGEGAVRDMALARAVAPMTAAGASHALSAGYSRDGKPLGGGAPPLPVLMAGALTELDTRAPLEVKRAAPAAAPASPPSQTPATAKRAAGAALTPAGITSPATAMLSALVSASKGGQAKPQPSLQGVALRGLMASTAAAPMTIVAGAIAAVAASVPTPSSAAAPAASAPAEGMLSVYAAHLRLAPSIVSLALALSQDAGACSAMLGLPPDQLRAMHARQALIIAERLVELSGSMNPGAKAGRAAKALLEPVPARSGARGGLPLSPHPTHKGKQGSAPIPLPVVRPAMASLASPTAAPLQRIAGSVLPKRSPPPVPAPTPTAPLRSPSAEAGEDAVPVTVRSFLASASISQPSAATLSLFSPESDSALLAARARLAAANAARAKGAAIAAAVSSGVLYPIATSTEGGFDSPLASYASPPRAGPREPLPDLTGMDEEQALNASLADMARRMEAAKLRTAALAALSQHAGDASSPSGMYETMAGSMARRTMTGAFANALLRARPTP
jgi:hypothetical protein